MKNWPALLVTSVVLTGCGLNYQDKSVDLNTLNVDEEVASLDELDWSFGQAFGVLRAFFEFRYVNLQLTAQHFGQ